MLVRRAPSSKRSGEIVCESAAFDLICIGREIAWREGPRWPCFAASLIFSTSDSAGGAGQNLCCLCADWARGP